MTDTYVPRFETQTDQRVPVPWTNCTPASGAMLLDWWTWGQTRTDDVRLRNASGVPTNLGMNFAALAKAFKAAFGLTLRYSEWSGSGNAQMTWRQLRDHLANGGGAAVAGDYAKLAPYKSTDGKSLTRWQPGGNFGHCIFVCDYDRAKGTVRILDPLGHGGYEGDVAPLTALWAFIYKVGNDADARITAAHSFAGGRPAKPSPPAPSGSVDWAGKVSPFGTVYPAYIHTDTDALGWLSRNIRRLRAAKRIIGF